MIKPEGFVFDFDGVMGNTVGVHSAARKQAFESNGFYVSEEIHAEGHRHGSTPPVIIHWVLKEAGHIPADSSHETDPTSLKVTADKEALYRTISSLGMEAQPGAVKLVHWASRRFGADRTAIASTATVEHEINPYLKKYDLIDMIGAVAGREDTPNDRRKPDPYVYGLAAERMGILPAQLAAIDDTPNGIKSAVSAGYGLVIGFAEAFTGEELIEAGAHVTVTDLLAVPALIAA